MSARSETKPVTLALQGGGAHGAFVWGVLDAFLQDQRLSVEAISATSAGAMNAVVLAYGLATGGAAGARESLSEFWQEVARTAQQAGAVLSPADALVRACGLPPDFYPSYLAFHTIAQLIPPHLVNPLNLNPLRDILNQVVDFERLNAAADGVKLFLNSTNVRTGKIKVFETPAITVEAVLASACLPPYFQAIEIDGEHYWDGGYMGNPALFPLIYREGSRDVIVVHVNPIERPDIPKSTADIMHRVNEISFNSSLMREMRAVAFVTRLIDTHELDDEKYHRMLIHWLGNDAFMAQLGTASQFYPEWDLLCRLRDEGRQTALRWLNEHYEDIGRRSTVDLASKFL
jgi:NTE family protein